MKKLILFVALLALGSNVIFASDTLVIKHQKIISLKSNAALLLFRGLSLQAEYIANKHIGVWAEATQHLEAHSLLDVALRERNFLTGINFYGSFMKHDSVRTHNGPYAGVYFKYKEGYYGKDKLADYRALFAGVQAGIQAVSRQRLIFNMGIGFGVGHYIHRNELPYPTFYDRYKLPVMDLRANISLGYMF